MRVRDKVSGFTEKEEKEKTHKNIGKVQTKARNSHLKNNFFGVITLASV